MTTIDVAGFRRDGWLHVPGVLDRGELDTIDDAVTELERWATMVAPDCTTSSRPKRSGDRPQRGLRERQRRPA